VSVLSSSVSESAWELGALSSALPPDRTATHPPSRNSMRNRPPQPRPNFLPVDIACFGGRGWPEGGIWGWFMGHSGRCVAVCGTAVGDLWSFDDNSTCVRQVNTRQNP